MLRLDQHSSLSSVHITKDSQWELLPFSKNPDLLRLYALKRGVFVKWCCDRDIDPGSCPVSDFDFVFFSSFFLLLDNRSLCGRYCFVSLVDGQSIGRHALVVRFLKGVRRLHPTCPPSVPPLDLALVLKALSLPSFEP